MSFLKKKAEEAFAKLHKSGELTDDELGAVSGGGCAYESGDAPVFSVGQRCKYVRVGLGKATTQHGEILKISDERKGVIYKEFVYTIKNDKDGKVEEIYENLLMIANT